MSRHLLQRRRHWREPGCAAEYAALAAHSYAAQPTLTSTAAASTALATMAQALPAAAADVCRGHGECLGNCTLLLLQILPIGHSDTTAKAAAAFNKPLLSPSTLPLPCVVPLQLQEPASTVNAGVTLQLHLASAKTAPLASLQLFQPSSH